MSVKRLARRLFPAAVAAALNACVVGAETRAGRLDIAEGPPPAPDRPATAGALIAQGSHPRWHRDPAAPKDARRSLPVSGYAHWDGVRYVWVETAEVEAPAFRWR